MPLIKMRRVLIVSPHFPPDTSAGTHRMRLLAPYLDRYGWKPTIVTVDARDYESRLDPELERMVDPALEVVRCRALSVSWTRRLGIGDLGLRAFWGLYKECRRRLLLGRHDVLLITLYPTYPALLGPILKRATGIPFVLDYQDPWVGAWGLNVGAGRNGTPDVKSKLTRALASRLEPLVVRHAAALTAVSEGTYKAVLDRNPAVRHIRCAAIPLGGEPRDFELVRNRPRANTWFDPQDGKFHLCYVGTLLPMGFETLRAVLLAAARLRERHPALYARLRIHFFGTGNQTAPDTPQRVLPAAQNIGVSGIIQEISFRIDYVDALSVQMQASALLLMGSSERHYTASKIYPALLSRRPILAIYHSASTVVSILRDAGSEPTIRIVEYDDSGAERCVDAIYEKLRDLIDSPLYDVTHVNIQRVHDYSAERLADRMARVLNEVIDRKHAC